MVSMVAVVPVMPMAVVVVKVRITRSERSISRYKMNTQIQEKKNQEPRKGGRDEENTHSLEQA